MKKLTILVASGILLAVALPLMAETETVGGYTWTYRIKGDTAEISGVSPSSGAIIIPSTLGGGSCKTFFDGRVDRVDLDAEMFQSAHGAA